MDTMVRFLLLATFIGVTLAFPDKLGYSQELHESETKLSKTQKVVAVKNEGEEKTDEEYEKRPYSFAWKASRYYNGAPDREHIEERDNDGITRGVFRYVDPRQQVQEVVYHSDASGFHVDASNLPQDTPTVSAAREKHLRLFDKIRLEHEKIAKELQDTDEEVDE